MANYDKGYIYFDTNALECRHSGKALYLSQFTVSPLYYKIEDVIRRLGLGEKVEICIPEITWLELQEHLANHYKSEKASMKEKIEAFHRSFGDLAEVYLDFKMCETETDYWEYEKEIAQEFLNNPRVHAQIIPCPKEEDSVQQIILQAVQSVKPFRKAKTGKKEYSDAGFKDAMIFNTIVKHTGDQLGIFITNDTDFDEVFREGQHSNLKICKDEAEVEQLLTTEFNVLTEEIIKNILDADGYVMKRILSECGFDEELVATQISITSQQTADDIIEAKFNATVDDAIYCFDISYNLSAQELISADCDVLDEENEDKDE